jgi:hypothetical protein
VVGDTVTYNLVGRCTQRLRKAIVVQRRWIRLSR